MTILTSPQSRALAALWASKKTGGWEAAGAICARGSTMNALVQIGFAERRARANLAYLYRITCAGHAALEQTNQQKGTGNG